VNTFATIKRLNELCGGKVNYYSVHFEDNEENEFFEFLGRMEDEPEVEDELEKLIVWLELIADQYGAQQKFFRHEGLYSDTSALPPPRHIMLINELEVNHLRLYCLRANEHVVFIFNGGIKSQGIDKAQDCPNVRPYFIQANELTKKINELFQQQIIRWNEDHSDIIIENEGLFQL
jgi:hypothetical protein